MTARVPRTRVTDSSRPATLPRVMAPSQPYRDTAEPPSAPPPPSLTLAWEDAENRPNPMLSYAAVVGGAMLAGMTAAISPWVSAAVGLSAPAYAFWNARRRRPLDVRLEVVGGVVVIERGGARDEVPLGALREVEIDRKAIRRVTYAQEVGAPTPTTSVSGDVDIARIALVVEGAAEPVLLTRAYASYSECTERFGAVRVFLRRHGWLPEGERVTA